MTVPARALRAYFSGMAILHRALGPSLVVLLAAAAACSPDASTTATATGADDDGAGGGSSGDGGGSSSDGGASSSSSPTVTATSGDPTTSTSSSGEGGGGAGEPCAEGTILCTGTTKQVCDGNGGFSEEVNCAPGVCLANAGCTLCAPGSGTCEGNVSTVCNGIGTGFDTYVCDPEQGVTCNAASGNCEGACAPQQLGTSYIGCDYFPTVTVNTQLQNFDNFFFQSSEGNFAVAVANTAQEATNVQVHRGATLVTTVAVAADSVQVIILPWVYELKNATSSQVLVDGAYRLRTNRPVTVYQYNPIQYTTPNGSTYTNDASLLLPVNALTGTYRVASRNAWHFDEGDSDTPGFYTVTATQDGTTVTLAPSATGGSVLGGSALPASGAGTVTLDEGDVLQVLSTMSGFNVDPVDLTGTLVTADKPIQVVAGHDCTNVPATVSACDHLEESMLPVETLATEYLVTPPLIPTGGTTPKAQMVRVIAVEAATTITYDPPQSGAPTTLTNAGDYLEIAQTAADFLISADKRILVAQYMQGQDAGGGSGDPAMALAVATEQYRSDYLFHAPTNYSTNYVNITAPTGATVMLDGVAVSGFTPIGGSGYAIARVGLSNAGDGNHRASSADAFGISVYGYGQYTSYWYPGGLDLDKVDTND